MAFDFHYMQNSLFQNMCVGQTSSVDSRSINAFSIRTDKEMFQKRRPSIFLIDPCLFFGLSWISKNHWALLRANLSIMQGLCVCLGGNRGARGGDLIPKHLKEEVAKLSTHSRVSVYGRCPPHVSKGKV